MVREQEDPQEADKVELHPTSIVDSLPVAPALVKVSFELADSFLRDAGDGSEPASAVRADVVEEWPEGRVAEPARTVVGGRVDGDELLDRGEDIEQAGDGGRGCWRGREGRVEDRLREGGDEGDDVGVRVGRLERCQVRGRDNGFCGCAEGHEAAGELSAVEGVVGGQEEVEVRGGKRPVIQAKGGLLPPASASQTLRERSWSVH